MTCWQRVLIPGGTYFFTVATERRQPVVPPMVESARPHSGPYGNLCQPPDPAFYT